MISRLDHVSIAVKDFEKARKFFTGIMGAVSGSSGSDENMKFFWEIFTLGDLSRIELITPTGEGSFIDNFLQNKEGGAHHITLQVPDIVKAREKLNEHSIPYFDGHDYGDIWKEIFIHPKHAFGILIQISEFNPADWISDEAKLPDNLKWEIKKNENGCRIDFSHPGGGKVEIDLSNDELKGLISNLQEAL